VGESGNLEFQNLLLQLSPAARDRLRRVLIRNQADRDYIAAQLMRY
jgi:hypothetical protein